MRNTGDCNTGDCNTGNWNTGDWNTGDWNKASFSSGCFNTEEQNITLFNKPSGWKYRDWLRSDARHILNKMPSAVVGWTGRLRKEDNRSTTEFRPVHFLQEHWNQSRGGIKSGMIDKKYLTN